MSRVAATDDMVMPASRRIAVPDIVSTHALQPIPGRDRFVCVRGETMGTTWSVRFYAASVSCAPQVRQAVQATLDHVVAEMSPWVPGSALSLFNAAPAGSWHALPVNFFAVLKAALSVSRDSGGAFDPTLGALANVWGFGPDAMNSEMPDARRIEGFLARAGWQRLDVDHEHKRVRQPGGLSIDLCGIAKGFGVDQIARALRQLGVRDFLVDVGGELRGEGVKPDGTPWWVSVEDPPGDTSGSSGRSDIVIALHGQSVATSGDYRRFVERDGRRYAHTIDPRSGRPVDNDVVAVTVLHESCMLADAFATAMMVMGLPTSLSFATEHRIAARFITRGNEGLVETLTPSFARLLDDEPS
jgi:thiamine biosynthesis lipoprotein